ncbi:MAG TPA: STAS/SEC14 domain-containing protein [Polyangiaceae bacterium]
METAQFDDSAWPIVRVTTPSYILNDEDYLRYLDQLTAFHERGERFGFLFDVRKSPAMPADQRRLTAERIDRDAAHYQRRCPCALVVASAIQRGVIRVVMWLLRDPHPVAVFSSIEQAEEWLRYECALKSNHPSSGPK